MKCCVPIYVHLVFMFAHVSAYSYFESYLFANLHILIGFQSLDIVSCAAF